MAASNPTPRKYSSERYARTRETVLANLKQRYAEKRELYRGRVARYQAEHPGKASAVANSTRAKKAGATGGHTLEQWEALLASCRHLCLYCGTQRASTRDHIIPLSRGGSDWISNIAPACRKCNAKKHDKLPEEWIYSGTVLTLVGHACPLLRPTPT